jgi:hypothetical protein
MTQKIPPTVSEYMAKIGAKGGKNGKGVKKTRTASHYPKIWAASAKARKKKAASKA